MSDHDVHISENNNKKLQLIGELIGLLTTRDPIDYDQFNPSINPNVTLEQIADLNDSKEVEVKALQSAWEQWEYLGELLFNELQITLQEKNQLYTFYGDKRKLEKLKKKNRGRSRTQVWRAGE